MNALALALDGVWPGTTFIASELKLAGQGTRAEPTRIDSRSKAGSRTLAPPRTPVPQSRPMLLRIPITRDVLQSLKDDLFAIEAERGVRTAP